MMRMTAANQTGVASKQMPMGINPHLFAESQVTKSHSTTLAEARLHTILALLTRASMVRLNESGTRRRSIDHLFIAGRPTFVLAFCAQEMLGEGSPRCLIRSSPRSRRAEKTNKQ